MALTDALPSPGIVDMLGIAASLGLAGPLLVATYLFASSGDVAMAAFTAVVALVALYLPTYVLRRVVPSSILPASVRAILDRIPFR